MVPLNPVTQKSVQTLMWPFLRLTDLTSAMRSAVMRQFRLRWTSCTCGCFASVAPRDGAQHWSQRRSSPYQEAATISTSKY